MARKGGRKCPQETGGSGTERRAEVSRKVGRKWPVNAGGSGPRGRAEVVRKGGRKWPEKAGGSGAGAIRLRLVAELCAAVGDAVVKVRTFGGNVRKKRSNVVQIVAIIG